MNEAIEELTPVMKKFILHWGEMGSNWGISRAVAQIYAIIYLCEKPITAEDISNTLALARSTVSTGLHELQGWGVVHVVHVLGDRRDHFETSGDAWEMFRAILNERKRREIDPTLHVLTESVAELKDEKSDDAYIEERLQEMLEIFESISNVYEQLDRMPTSKLKKITKLGDNLTKVISSLG